jgi:hypothetical protein
MNRLKSIQISALFVLLLLVFAATGRAQVTTATIEGLILDPSAAVIPGASVTVASEGTVLKRTELTNNRGEFTFAFLPPGAYTITVDATGFKIYRQTGLELVAGQNVRRDFKLEIGAAGEQVTVTAETPLVNAVSAEQDVNLTETAVRELPLARRDLRNLLNLGTGISAGTDVGVSMNGLPPRGFLFTIDGVNAAGNSELRSLGLYQDFNIIKGVSIEAVEQVQVARGLFSADVANTVGGNVNLITKRGTNGYHGSVFENYQAGGFNARNQFATTPESLVFHQFGGSFGGPIRKDSMFFFGAFEGYRLTAQRALTGYTPTQEFRNQVIQANPAMKAGFDYLPLPTDPYTAGAQVGFYRGRGAAKQIENHATARWDWNVTATNLLSVRYKRGRPDVITPSGIPENPQDQKGMDESVVASYIHLSPTWSSETRGGFNRDDMTRVNNFYNLGVVRFAGQSISMGSGEILAMSGSTSTIDQNFALMRGRHSFKLGGTFQLLFARRFAEATPLYSYLANTDMIAGNPYQGDYRFPVNWYQMHTWQLGGYIQDDMKISRRLTLNLGLRYDYWSVPKERDNRIFNHAYPGGPLVPPDQIWVAQYMNFSPRFGLAWRLDEQGKTVLRTGYGIFMSAQNLFSGTVETIRNGPNVPTTASLSRAELQTYKLNYPDPSSKALAAMKLSPINSDQTIDTHYENPYSQQWTLGIQRQLTRAMVLDVAYVGSHALNLPHSRNFNRVDRVTGVRTIAGFGDFVYYSSNDSSYYDALQTSLQKRFSSNLMFDVTYTWASNMAYFRGDMHCCGGGEQEQDLNNLAANKGPTTFFVRHTFRTNWIYELPLARLIAGRGRVAELALGGWQVSGILLVQSGESFNLSQTSAVQARPDVIDPANVYGTNWWTDLQYLNKAAFAKVPVNSVSKATVRPGNVGHRSLFLPGYWNPDLSLSKRFRFTERVNLQFRADMFNAFNMTFFSGLSTGIDSSTFGRFTGSRGARVVQFNFRLQF